MIYKLTLICVGIIIAMRIINGVAGRPRGGEDTASELQTIALTKPAGRPRGAHTHRAREKKKQFHPGAEDNLPEQDLTILRLGAKGHFNLQFDSKGRLILP
jgi:hypothetical protein